MARRGEDERLTKADFDRLLEEFPASVEIDGLPELHQRASMTVLGKAVDIQSLVFGVLATFILIFGFITVAPWWLAIPAAVAFGVRFGISRNVNGDGILQKRPKLRRKLRLLVPNRVRQGVVTPTERRLIAVVGGQEGSWAELEERLNARTR